MSTSLIKIIANSPWLVVALTVTLAFGLRLIQFFRRRYKAHLIFDEGNIPSIGNKNPISGNIYEILMPPDNFKIVRDLHDRLGNTFGIFYGEKPWALTQDLELLQKVFVIDSRLHTDNAPLNMPFIRESDRSLVQLRGNEWRLIRRILDPLFTRRQMKSDNVYKDIEDSVDKLIKCIEGHPQDRPGERVVDIKYNSTKYSVNIIFKVAFGFNNATNMRPGERDELIEAINYGEKYLSCKLAWLSVMFRGLQVLLSKLVRFTPVGKSIKYIHTILDHSVQERRKILDSPGDRESSEEARRIMVDTLLRVMQSANIDDDTVRANLFFFFLAGFETTANTLAILCWFLAKHQHIQDKLREAVMREGVDAQYLEWCVKETLRLFPAVPMTGRVAEEDITTSKGQTIFKDTVVLACIYSIHHNAEYWGPDVEEFRPERFGDPNLLPIQFFGFGQGPRMCIGKNLAMAEIYALVTRLIVLYRIEPCDSTPASIGWTSPNLIHLSLEGPINLKFVDLDDFVR